MIRKKQNKTKNLSESKITCMFSLVDLRVRGPCWIKRDPLVGNDNNITPNKILGGLKMTCMVSLVNLRVKVPWWIKRDPLVGNNDNNIRQKTNSWWIKNDTLYAWFPLWIKRDPLMGNNNIRQKKFFVGLK